MALCHCAVGGLAVASTAKHKCFAALYGVSPVPNRTTFSHPPFTTSPTPPPSLPRAGTTLKLSGLRLPPPPSFLSPPFSCSSPTFFSATCFSFFSSTPFVAPRPSSPLWSAPCASLPPSSYLAALAGYGSPPALPHRTSWGCSSLKRKRKGYVGYPAAAPFSATWFSFFSSTPLLPPRLLPCGLPLPLGCHLLPPWPIWRVTVHLLHLPAEIRGCARA